MCPMEATTDERGTIVWPETQAGEVTTLPCAIQVEGISAAFATRECVDDASMAMWMPPQTTQCPSPVTEDLLELSQV